MSHTPQHNPQSAAPCCDDALVDECLAEAKAAKSAGRKLSATAGVPSFLKRIALAYVTSHKDVIVARIGQMGYDMIVEYLST